MVSSGWGYTSILILGRAVVLQQSASSYLHLPGLNRYLGIARGLRYSNGVGAAVAEESLGILVPHKVF